MRFEELKVNPAILSNVKGMGFEKLTDIQVKTINRILGGRDIVGQAETGSGKTVAFSLPVLDIIEPGRGIQTLVLTPTRELCIQVSDVFRNLGKGLGVVVASVYGGVGIDAQIRKLRSTDIVVGTPGRILDHINRRTIDLSRVRFLVLDETDRMFDMGFIDDVEDIIRHVPRKRQTLIFGATIYGIMDHIIEKHLDNPIFVSTKTHVDKAKLKQIYYDIMHRNHKFSLLVHLLKNSTPGLALVFCATRRESDIVAKNLVRQGMNASPIHGGMSQHAREKSMEAIKNKKIDVLVATDVAARGLDIKNITHIYNYDVPNSSKEYIHRIGRTARAGKMGEAVTLLTERDHDAFRAILVDEGRHIRRKAMPSFQKVRFDRFLGDSKRRPRRNLRGSHREYVTQHRRR